MDRTRRLAEESIPRLLLSYSAPAVVGLLAQGMYYSVDRIFIGRVMEHQGIAGLTVCFPFMLVLMAFSMLIGFGAAALVSIRLGQRRRDEAELVLGNATLLLLAASAVVTVAGLLLLDPLLRTFGASSEVLPYAHQYLVVIVAAAVFQIVGFGLNAVIRGEGNPWTSMMTMIVSVVVNAVLAWVFIFVCGWRMTGAGLATAAAQAASCAWVVWYFLSGKSLLRLRLRDLWPRGSVCRAIVVIGSPAFAVQLAAALSNSLLNNQLRQHGGDTAVAVMGVIYSVVMMFAMPIFGINQGAQPIIGYNYGALRFDRVKQALQTAVLAASSISTLGFFLAMVFPEQVMRLFGRDSAPLATMGPHAIRLSLMMLPIIGFQVVASNYFQAVGKPRHAIFLSLSRQVLLLVPAVLILPRFLGLNGVWLAIPTADLCSSVLTGTWLWLELRHLDRRHAETTEGWVVGSG